MDFEKIAPRTTIGSSPSCGVPSVRILFGDLLSLSDITSLLADDADRELLGTESLTGTTSDNNKRSRLSTLPNTTYRGRQALTIH